MNSSEEEGCGDEDIEKKLEEAIIMIDAYIRHVSYNQSFSYSSSSSSSSPTQSLMSDDRSEMDTRRRRVNIDREQFLLVCERYESLRKLIIPIKYFYDAGLNADEHF